MLANKFSKDNVKSFLADKLVAEIFLALTIISIPLSGYSGKFIIDEILTRIARNSFLVFSLVLPIMAGMGINFGMVLGAMAGQIGLIFAMDWNISGLQGLVFAMLVGIPISVVLGFVAGTILNHARGREMVTSYILGFFFNGIYQFVVLYLFGSIIPLHNKAIALSRGWGVRNTLNLDPVRQALDNVLLVRISGVKVPLSTYIVVALLALFIVWFKRTKLGQDMRSVGLSQSVSRSQGIPVEMTRVVAIIISTVLACIGQLIFLQNLGNMQTYNAHDQTGFFAAAAILVGGASAKKASIANCLAGIVLLHLMYIVVPRAGQNLFGNANIGEYFRQFIGYGVIALALVIHAWRAYRNAEKARASLRGTEKNQVEMSAV